jgi:hypothetical protein
VDVVLTANRTTLLIWVESSCCCALLGTTGGGVTEGTVCSKICSGILLGLRGMLCETDCARTVWEVDNNDKQNKVPHKNLTEFTFGSVITRLMIGQ